MSYYKQHVFFCTNVRESGRSCCGRQDANELRNYMKERLKALKMTGAGHIRINSAGCMGRCDEGPVLVVYPDELWYRFASKADIDLIIEQHILKGEPVARLLLANSLPKVKSTE